MLEILQDTTRNVKLTLNDERESVKVLKECIDLQIRKSADYQNERSSVKQAMHYRRGLDTIHDMLHQKMLRALSLIETMKNEPDSKPKFESLEDTYKDIINYSSFAVSYMRGKMDGQDPNKDMFNEDKGISLPELYDDGWPITPLPEVWNKDSPATPADWAPPVLKTGPIGLPMDSIAETAKKLMPDLYVEDENERTMPSPK